MKTKLIILMIGIFFIALVGASVLSYNTIKVSNEDANTLNTMNIKDISLSELKCKGELCSFSFKFGNETILKTITKSEFKMTKDKNGSLITTKKIKTNDELILEQTAIVDKYIQVRLKMERNKIENADKTKTTDTISDKRTINFVDDKGKGI